ncbi:MAG: hypothetical protein LBB56_02310 [Chitinispirillales bacterium]|jgi:type IV secretory pathway VirD2 relaxase|nr:hypothetical protein [Chitinispirillales bacterium]
MKTSKVMEELRRIRDENSARHVNMTIEELRKESDEVLERFARRLKKPLRIVEGPRVTLFYPSSNS